MTKEEEVKTIKAEYEKVKRIRERLKGTTDTTLEFQIIGQLEGIRYCLQVLGEAVE